jgi:hypothetical protein
VEAVAVVTVIEVMHNQIKIIPEPAALYQEHKVKTRTATAVAVVVVPVVKMVALAEMCVTVIMVDIVEKMVLQ